MDVGFLLFCFAEGKCKRGPIAVPCVRLAVGTAALHTDRGYSLRSLYLPQAALPSLPLPAHIALRAAGKQFATSLRSSQ